MRAKYIAGLAAVVGVVTSGYVGAAESADQLAVRKQYAIFAQAIREKNASRIINLETSDFSAVTVKKVQKTKAQRDASLRGVLSVVKTVNASRVTVRSVSVKGGTATVVADQYVSLTIADPRDPKAKDLVFTDDSTSRDTWIKTRQGWRIRRSQELSDKATVNGKPIKTS